MKLSLLDMVQDILSDLNDDEVNSISDTIESLQVAQIVKSVFFEMIAGKNWPHLRQLKALDSSTDNTKPTHMSVPELVKEVEWIEYNKKKTSELTRNRYEQIKYLAPDDFLRLTSSYNNTLDSVDVITDYSGVQFNIRNDRQPEYWTSFDDNFVVFNAYNKEIESTLQSSNSRMSCFIEPSWSMTDSFIPDLPSEAFPALLAEAKSVCFARIKQMPDQKAEQQAVRQKNWLSRKAWRVKGGITLPNYARRTKK